MLGPTQIASAIHWLTLHGRVRDGASVPEAAQRMRAIYAGLISDKSMDEDAAGTIEVRPLARLLLGDDVQRTIRIAFGAVVLVLLIACANVSSLLLARGTVRKTELAVRSALGAGRGRLVLQLLTECLAVCVLGGIAGAAVAFALLRIAKQLLTDALPFTADVRLDLRALLFGTVVVLGVALLTGVLPAFKSSAENLVESLKQLGRGAMGAHVELRRGIVVGEVAVSLILVCGALLLLRSLSNLENVPTGVRIENIVTAAVNPSTEAYPTGEKAALLYDMLERRLAATPGVTRVG